METVLQTTLVTAVAGAVVGFYATAFIRPAMFKFLFKPFCAATMGLAVVGMAFLIGAQAATFAAEDRISSFFDGQKCTSTSRMDIYTSISAGFHNGFMMPSFIVVGFSVVLLIIAAFCVTVANFAFREEAKKEKKT